VTIFFKYYLLGFQVIEHKAGEVSSKKTLSSEGAIQLRDIHVWDLCSCTAIKAKECKKGNKNFFQELTGF
jgi:hypothetical protein